MEFSTFLESVPFCMTRSAQRDPSCTTPTGKNVRKKKPTHPASSRPGKKDFVCRIIYLAQIAIHSIYRCVCLFTVPFSFWLLSPPAVDDAVIRWPGGILMVRRPPGRKKSTTIRWALSDGKTVAAGSSRGAKGELEDVIGELKMLHFFK